MIATQQVPQFNQAFTQPEYSLFKVVFFPDRIYHQEYLCAAPRSTRYRYNITEVHNKLDITALKGEIFLDGQFLCNFLRIEYRATRLTEKARTKNRTIQNEIMAWIKLLPENAADNAEAVVKMRYDHAINAYQVEIWETLEVPLNTNHDYTVLDLMGRDGPITRVRQFGPALRTIQNLKQIALAFRENDQDLPAGHRINENDVAWDNNYESSHQEPRTDAPGSDQNTIADGNYLIDYQKGWFLQASEVPPVRYVNPMMDDTNPDRDPNNIIEMRWLLQRQIGSSVVFFHEVTVPPGKTEGTHQHMGTEELYYIVEGEGTAYMGEGDDPNNAQYPLVQREVMGLGQRDFRELPLRPGCVIYTKSGGMHGIHNTGAAPLKFVAFLYHTV